MKLKKKIYLLLLCVSLLSTGLLVYNRVIVENNAKTVEMIADYHEFSIFARQLGITDLEIFKELKNAGFTSVAIVEDTLFSMVNDGEPLEYDLFMNVAKNLEWESLYGEEAAAYLKASGSKYDMVIRTYDVELFNRLRNAIIDRYDSEFYKFYEDEVNTIVLKGSIDELYFIEDFAYKTTESKAIKRPRREVSSELEDIGLGFNEVKISNVKNSGMSVNLRPINFEKYSTNIANAYISDIKRYGSSPNTMIFGGKGVLGYQKGVRNYSPELFEFLDENSIPVGMIESTVQRGFTDQFGIGQLVQESNYNAVRVFPVVEYIQERYDYLGYYKGSIEIENTMYRAITERNIRAVYFRPYKASKFTYHEVLEDYGVMLGQLSDRLKPHGISIGMPSVMPYSSSHPILLMLSALGLLILGLVALKLIFDITDKFEMLLLILGVLFIPVSTFITPNRSIDLFALAAANIYPTLAIIFYVEYVKDIFLSNKVYNFKSIVSKAVVGLFVAIIICLVGGLSVSGIMSRSDYLLEMSYFRGVKLSLLFPMIIFVVIYIIKLGYNRDVHDLEENTFFIEDLKTFIYQNVKIYYLLIFGLLVGIVYIYVARSGHEAGVEALNSEIIFRNYLENWVLARPRTKEILMAFPAFFASIYIACRGYQKILFPFALASMVGFSSVVNTFCHTRTPIYLSTARTFISLGLGIIIGIAVLVLMEFINRVYIAYFGSKNYE